MTNKIEHLSFAFGNLADAYDDADWVQGDESGVLLVAENLLAHLRQAMGDGIPEGAILNHYVALANSVAAEIESLQKYQ